MSSLIWTRGEGGGWGNCVYYSKLNVVIVHEVNKTLISTIPSFLLPSHLLLSPPLPLSPFSPPLFSPSSPSLSSSLSPLSSPTLLPHPPPTSVSSTSAHSTLYWTTLSRSGFGRSIQYMSLNSPNVVDTLNVSGKTKDLMIDKLTFEPSTKSLYWINRSNTTNSTIERFDILSGNLTIIAAGAASVSGMYLYLLPLHHHCHYSTCGSPG